MSGRDVGGESFQNKDSLLTEVEEEKVSVFEALGDSNEETGMESGNSDGHFVIDHELINGTVESAGASIKGRPHGWSLLLDLLEYGISRRDPKRVTDEGACEEADSSFRE